MSPLMRASLPKRIILLVALGMLVMVAVLGVSSLLAVGESIDRALEERLVLAQTIADHLEYVLNQNLRRLDSVAISEGVNLADGSLEPEKRALHDAYLNSIFGDGVFILDGQGKVLWIEPYQPRWVEADLSGYDQVRNALDTGKPGFSDVFALGPSGKEVVSAVTPIKDRDGRILGLVGGYVDLTGSSLQQVIGPARLGQTGYAEVIDSRGVVLASTNPALLLTKSDHKDILANLIQSRQTTRGRCHSCHQEAQEQRKRTEVMAFAPLPTVPWGVSIMQSEAEALAPANRMKQRFAIFGVSLSVFALLLAWGTVRSVVKPIKVLTNAAGKIAGGNLTDPIPPLGSDEIGQLAQSFDTMRARLKESLERIQEWNKELERSVRERTKELEESRVLRGELLRKLISAQEEERRRIARELHDDASQTLATLAMAMDTAAVSAAKDSDEWKERLASMKNLVVGALDGLHQVIFDLRPSVLDDLGLLPALQWLAENRLGPLGIKVRFEAAGEERRLGAQVETAVFRAVQEAISNIAKHAQAQNVLISVEFQKAAVTIEVEDDGRGFNVEEVTRTPDQTRGLGLLGMIERIALLGGHLSIRSEPGGGTCLTIEVPLSVKDFPRG